MSAEPAPGPTPDDTGEYPKATEAPRDTPHVTVEARGLTHKGRVRSNNEDQFLIAKLAKSMRICQTSLPDRESTRFSAEEGHLLIVADGMGGVAGGEEASRIAIASVEEFVLETLKWFLHLGGKDEGDLKRELREALEQADRSVMSRAWSHAALSGMGTTLTMGYSVADHLFVLHAGDSRAYLWRDGELDRITSDHTLVQLLIEGGMLTPEDARKHNRRNVITNVVGGPSAGVHAEIHKVLLRDGDVLLLCTDGLTEPVDEARIAEILASGDPVDATCGRLVDAALEAGGPDNVTVILARYQIR